jgi:surface protein
MLFFACRSLKSVDVSSFDTSIVMDMHDMFDGCINLEFLNITNFVYNSRTSIGNGYLDIFQEDAKLHLIISITKWKI